MYSYVCEYYPNCELCNHNRDCFFKKPASRQLIMLMRELMFQQTIIYDSILTSIRLSRKQDERYYTPITSLIEVNNKIKTLKKRIVKIEKQLIKKEGRK